MNRSHQNSDLHHPQYIMTPRQVEVQVIKIADLKHQILYFMLVSISVTICDNIYLLTR